MTSAPSTFNVAAQARRTATAAASSTGIVVREVETISDLKLVSALFETVWGRSPEGVPLGSELMRSLVHAGGAATAAYDGTHELVGAAVLVLAEPVGTTYSLIAATCPGRSDRGIGYALKQHQRAWALERGLDTMSWTFDPLVGRNARFNLTKLGAEAHEYEQSFYGLMTDAINAVDDSDRLVARWSLSSPRAVAASERTAPDPGEPEYDDSDVLAVGPDGRPVGVQAGTSLWCRVPTDIVALRRSNPAQAAAWRQSVRNVLTAALASGRVATGMTRSGWYHLTQEG